MEGSRLEGAAGGAVTLCQRGGGGLEERSAEINTLIDWLIYLSSLTQTDTTYTPMIYITTMATYLTAQ